MRPSVSILRAVRKATMLLALLLALPAWTLNVDFDYHILGVDKYLAGSGSAIRLQGVDGDANGLLEEDQLGMLSAILEGGARVGCLDSALVAAIQAGYPTNYARVATDLTVTISFMGTVNILNELGETDPLAAAAFQHVLAGLMTVADTATITYVNYVVDSLVAIYLTNIGQTSYIVNVQNQINFTAANYKTFGNAPTEPDYLGPAGNVDGDGSTNLQEYTVGSVRKDRETWLTDNCITPPLRITSVTGGGLRISGVSETFAVTIAGNQGPVSYEWRKGSATSYVVVSTASTYTIDFATTSHSGTYYCVVTDGVTTRQTPPATLTVVYVALFICQHPSGGNKLTGQSHTFRVTAQGGNPGPYQYTWRRDGVVVGPNAATWTIDPLALSDDGSYTVSVTSNGGADTVTSNAAVLHVTASPFTLTAQPAGANKYVGDSHTFSVTVSGGSGSFTYDWRKDGASIGAPSSPSLTLDPLAKADAGSYTCVVTDTTNPETPVSSNAAVLQVKDPVVILEQPQGATLYVGDTFSIAVLAEGGYGTLHYQWRWYGLAIPGRINPIYSAVATTGNNGPYTCEVRDDNTAVVTSAAAVLVVVTPIVITAQPVGGDHYTGESHTFSVTATGGVGSQHYEWRKDGVALGAPDAATLALTGLTPDKTGAYTCRITDDYTYAIVTAGAILRVADPMSITQQPQAASLYEGGSHSLQVIVTGGIPPLAYQWYQNGAPLGTKSGNTLDLSPVAAADEGNYSCRITDDAGAEITSATAAVTVRPRIAITTPPASASVYVGSPHVFTLSASGGYGTLHYVWRKGEVPLGSPDAPELPLDSVTADHAGVYSCVVQDELSDVIESPPATLAVANPLVITLQPAGRRLYIGQSHVFRVETAGGFPPCVYQWRREGAILPEGVLAEFNTGAVSLADAGVYTCAVTDALGSEVVTDGTAVLAVAEPVLITSALQPADLYEGDSHVFNVAASGGFGALHYEWRRNGQNLGAPDAPSLALDSVTAGVAGQYSCEVRDEDTSQALSGPVELRIAPPLTITDSPVGAEAYVGGAHTFLAAATGGYPPLAYRWRRDGLDVADATERTYNLPNLLLEHSGAYVCAISDAVRASAVTQEAVLSVVPHLVITASPGNADKYTGDAHVFTVTAEGGRGTLHYAWRKNGENLGAPDQATLAFAEVRLEDSGEYTCEVWDQGTDRLTSAPARLRVGDPLTITAQPQGGGGYIGESFEFSVSVTGGIGALHYQWQQDGVNETNATQAVYTKGPLFLSSAGSYTCAIQDDAGTTIGTEPAILRVGTRISLLLNPAGATIYTGRTHLFFVSAVGGIGVRRYEWLRDDVSLGTFDTPAYEISAAEVSDSGAYTCLVTDECTDATRSDAAQLTVIDHLLLPVPLVDAHRAAGETHVFDAAPHGGIPPLACKWFKNGVLIPEATESVLTLSPLTLGHAGTYRCEINDLGEDGVATEEVSLTVLGITSQPVGASKRAGESHTFTISASGGFGNLQYDWRHDGVSLSSPSQPELALSSLTQADQGVYTCVVSDAGGAALCSNEAYLQVSDNPIVFNTEPVGAAKYAGETHTFQVAVSGGTPDYTYAWQLNAGSGFADVPGTSSATYATGALTLAQAGQYRCRVQDAGGQVAYSATVTLTVAEALRITTQPVAANRYVGGSAAFQVTASGGLGTLHYRWRRDGVQVGSDARTLTLNNLSLSDAGTYTCEIWDSRTTVTTNGAAVLRVGTPLAFTSQPVSASRAVGGAYTFSVAVSGGLSPITYQWRHNGVSIANATNPSYVLVSVQIADQGAYTCQVRDATSTTLTSNVAVLDVYAALTITSQPQGGACYVGESKTFSIGASGGIGTLHYLWRRNGVIVGTDSPTLSIASLTTGHAGDYTCLVSDGSTSLLSTTAVLRVGTVLTITGYPVGADKYTGGVHTFSVTAAGGIAPISYQWYKSSTAISGATSSTYTLAPLQLSHAGAYWCRVSDNGRMSLSTDDNGAILRVADPLRVTTTQREIAKNIGGSVEIKVSTTGGLGTLRYSWRRDGVQVSTAPSFTLSPLTLEDSGSYACTVTDDIGSLNAGVLVKLVVGYPLAIITQPRSVNKLSGDAHTFHVEARGTGRIRYTWFKNSAPIPLAADSPDYVFSRLALADAGSYRCVLTDATGAVVFSTSAILTITYRPPFFLREPVGGSVAIGFPYTFLVEVGGGSGRLHYYWRKDGLPAPFNADVPWLTLLPVVDGDAGCFTCEVSDDLTTAVSQEAHLTTDAKVPVLTPAACAGIVALLACAGVRSMRRKR